MISRQIRSELQALLMLLVLIAPGCQQMLSFRQMKLATLPSASAEHPVYEAICLWEPGEGTGLDGLPTRGFNGKVMFFARGIDASVRVKGDMTVYVFDDQGTVEQQAQPIHQFNFSDEAVQTFLMNSELGASYQMFIPYTRKGQHKATCSLRVRLTPTEGRPVYSKMGAITLPGLATRAPEQPVGKKEVAPNDGVQLVSHEVSAQPAVAQAGKSTTSIDTSTNRTPLASEDKERLMSALAQMTRNANPQPAVAQGTRDAVPVTPQVPVSPAQPQKPVDQPEPVSSSGMRLKPAGGEAPKPTTNPLQQTSPQQSPLAEEKPATPASGHPLGD